MIPAPDVYTDMAGLAKLRADARADSRSPEALRKAASQFEALFIQMVLKSMREAKLADGMFENESNDHYRDMFDGQLSVSLSQGRGLGLADVIVRQLSQQAGVVAPPPAHGAPLKMPTTSATELGRSPESFVQTLWPHAQQVSEKIGVEPRALLAQAALETGWGQGTIRHADGRSSHNVFNIKATPDWRGERVRVTTTEYENGEAVSRTAEFRAYDSYAEAFADYARVLQQPRYAEARRQGGDPVAFGHALAGAGYATDPAYGRKLASVLNGYTLNAGLTALKISADGPLT